MEIWNESCSDFESDSECEDGCANDKMIPSFPKYSFQHAEKKQCTILAQWFIRFILILQGKFYLPDRCVDLLIKFLHAFFCVLGIIKRMIGLPRGFRKLIVCRKCLSIYKYKDCIDKASAIPAGKNCANVIYPHHPMPSKRVSCNTPLLKSVEFASGHATLYPHL